MGLFIFKKNKTGDSPRVLDRTEGLSPVFAKADSAVAKGVGILLLLFYHLFKDIRNVNDIVVIHRPFSDEAFVTMAEAARVCVGMFVIITAFGIAKGLLKREELDLATAYKEAFRRFWKALLGFVVLYVSVWAVWFWKFDYTSVYGDGKQGILYLITDALGMSDIFGTPTMNETWWYMGLLYLMIFLIPLLTFAVKKIGYGLLPFAVLTAYMFDLNYNLKFYLPAMIVGVCAAYGEWFDKLKNLKVSRWITWPVALVAEFLLLVLRQNAVVQEHFFYIVDAAAAFGMVAISGILLSGVPIVRQILEFIGKHSLNIFLVHTFFYLILWRYYIYHFEYAIVTYLLLLTASLLYSVILELIKSGFSKLFKKQLAVRRKKD